MEKDKWRPYKVTFPLGYFYVVRKGKHITHELNGKLYSTKYQSEAQEIADKLNEEEK